MRFNLCALLFVFIVGVAGEICGYQTGALRARDTATGSELGKVAIDLNSSGSFGLTTSTNSSLWARFQSLDDCGNMLFYFRILNPKNTALTYMSLVSGVTN
ncbi:hypothetical protein DL96DRAFT_1719749 [Flagelloscypha sp. PMI_526]|nr:hypothetical protein DL96DRAFT_1719749 [Flagelloscypha sp. PMI_526]